MHIYTHTHVYIVDFRLYIISTYTYTYIHTYIHSICIYVYMYICMYMYACILNMHIPCMSVRYCRCAAVQVGCDQRVERHLSEGFADERPLPQNTESLATSQVGQLEQAMLALSNNSNRNNSSNNRNNRNNSHNRNSCNNDNNNGNKVKTRKTDDALVSQLSAALSSACSAIPDCHRAERPSELSKASTHTQ